MLNLLSAAEKQAPAAKPKVASRPSKLVVKEWWEDIELGEFNSNPIVTAHSTLLFLLADRFVL